MGKKKAGKKSGIDWDDLVRASSPGPAAEGDGWHTGPASMALDDDDYGGPGAGGGAGGSGGAAADMDTADAAAVGLALKNKRKKGKRGGGSGGPGGDAMDTTDAPGGGRLGVNKGGGMKITGKRGSRTSAQLKRKMDKQEKALAFSDKLAARASGKMTKKQRKASLKTIY